MLYSIYYLSVLGTLLGMCMCCLDDITQDSHEQAIVFVVIHSLENNCTRILILREALLVNEEGN